MDEQPKPETPVTATVDRVAEILAEARSEAAMPPPATASAVVDPTPAPAGEREQLQAAADRIIESAGEPEMLGPRLEMRVEHLVEVQQRHLLRGTCPKCGRPIETSHGPIIAAFEAGQPHNCHCVHCNAQLVVPGKVAIVLPGNAGRVVVGNIGPNRHARRAGRKLPPPGARG